MSAIAVSAASVVFQPLVTSMTNKLKYIWSYGTYIKDLDDELIQLKDARARIEEQVKKDTRNGQKILDGVSRWMDEVDNITKQAAEVIEKHKSSKRACCYGVIPNPSTRFVIARQADENKQEIGKLQQRANFPSVSYPQVPDGIVTGEYKGPGTEYWMAPSRQRLLEDISKAILDPKVRMVGIWGPSGVGKSVFLKQLEKHFRDQRLNFDFGAVVMAVASRSPNWEKVQDDLGYGLGLMMKDESSMTQKAKRLRDRIKPEDKVLIILDDIWEKVDLEQLGINHPKIKLLLTSRSEQVLKNKMESEHNFHLEPLKPSDAMDLFKQILANQTVGESALIVDLVEQCLGLPVLISLLAASLKLLPPSTWADNLTKLLKQTKGLGVENIIEKSLEFNYHLIKSGEAKSLFMLCGRIGNQIISINHLLIYGLGLGLLKGAHTMEEAREKVKLLIDNLKESYLLMDNGDAYVKLHDLMGDAALSIASNACDSLVIRNRKAFEACNDDDFKGCRYMSLLLDDKELLGRLNCPLLEMLLVSAKQPIDLEIPDAFFKDLRELKVLNLSNVNITSLPSSIQSFDKLHTLCLNYGQPVDLMMIRKLMTLQVLTLGGYGVTRIQEEIGELNNLRLLDLSDCSRLCIIKPNVLRRLVRLEELILPLNFDNWDAEGISNASLIELNDMSYLSTLAILVPDVKSLGTILPFQQLVRYNLQIGKRWPSQNSGESRTLKLEFDHSNSKLICKEWLQTVLKKTQDLCLDGWIGLPETFTKLSKEGFPELKHVYIQYCPSIKYIIHLEQPDPIPILESLSLHALINLQKICEDNLPLGYLKNLKSIKIEACDELRNLFSLPLVRDVLPMLEMVEVSDCMMMHEIITNVEAKCTDDGRRDGDKVEMLEIKCLHTLKLKNLQNFSSFCPTTSGEIVDDDGNSSVEFLDGRQISLPHLESLTLYELPKLRKISHSQYPVNLKSLKSLELSKCKSLSYAIDFNLLRLLRNLETLAIEDCESMETIFHMDELNTHENITNHPPQIHLKLSKLPRLKKLWNQNIPFVLEVKKLEVSECDGLENLFSSSMVKSIRNISQISVASCMSMKEIFVVEEDDNQEIEFSSLSHLSISKMENLAMFSRGNHRYRFPCLIQLIISECPQMRTFASKDYGNEERSIEDVITDESFFNQKVCLPSLEKLILHSLGSMICIWDDNNLSKESFCLLATIEINNCGSVQSIFDSRLVERLQHLEEVVIESCESLEVLFEDVHGKLKSGSLKESVLGFPSLKEVSVSNCGKLINIFPKGTARTLSKLANIYISSCDSLVEVVSCDDDEGNMDLIEIMAFYNLTSLKLEYLARLVHFCSGNYELYLPLLKKVSIVWCTELKAFMTRPCNFVGSAVRSQEIGSTSNIEADSLPLFDEKVVFPNLEELRIEGLQVKEIWPKREPASFLTELKKLKVRNCDQLSIIFPSLVFHNFNMLESLSVDSCNSLKVVFQLENYCSSIRRRNLRSKSTTRVMEHLHKLTVSGCGSLQHVVAMSDDAYIGETYHKKVVFPQLSSLKLRFLPRLGSFCHNHHEIELPSLVELVVDCCGAVEVFVADTNQDRKPLFLVGEKLTEEGTHSECSLQSFSKLKELTIYSCDGLLTVFPYKMMRAFHNLERLTVLGGNSLKSVFESPELRSGTGSGSLDDVVPTTFALRQLYLWELPQMKYVWDVEDTRWSYLSFDKLYDIQISDCDSLRHVFPDSVARCLRRLNNLRVSNCKGMEGIIVWNEESAHPSPSPESTDFSIGMHSLEWPLIERLTLVNCPNAKMFSSIQQKISMPALYEMGVDASELESRQFLDEILYAKPRKMTLQEIENQQSIPWSLLLERFPHLQTLVVYDKGICGVEYISRTLEITEDLKISNCHRSTILVPSSAAPFRNLTGLRIEFCRGSPYVATSSVAKCLVQLIELSISSCEGLEEIVTYDSDEDGNNRAKDDAIMMISFPRLKSLKLIYLSSLRSFSSTSYKFNFPSLVYVKMEELPKMQVFCEGDFNTPYKDEITRNITALCRQEIEEFPINPLFERNSYW